MRPTTLYVNSQTGKRLMARCQMLLKENEELGKTIASGRTAKLEGEIALQKTLVTEMKNNQSGIPEAGELQGILFCFEFIISGKKASTR